MVLLDGSMPTELRLAGHSVEAPWWTNRVLMTGRGRALVRSIHEAHLAAGAGVLTATTFPCAQGKLLELELAPGSGTAWMVHAAVGVARAAVGGRPGVVVAGAVGPLADLPEGRLSAEHGWLVTELVRCGVDVVLAESMPSILEAVSVVDLAVSAGRPAWVSLRCADDARLPSAEPVAEAVLAVRERGAGLVAVSCGRPEQVETALRAVRERYAGPLGAYPDVAGHADDLARTCARWRTEYDLDLVGGCCGATAGHLRALSRTVVTAPATGS